MDPDIGGAGGWLSNLLSGAGGNPVWPTSIGGQPLGPDPSAPGNAIPGAAGPTSVGGAPLGPNPNAPTIQGGMQALQSAAPQIQKAMAPPAPAPAPQINMARPQGGGQYAQALAQVMAKLNQQNKIGGPTTPQRIQ
jgi:hypothetical protein